MSPTFFAVFQFPPSAPSITALPELSPLKFTGGKLLAKQVGECGFGNRVSADGTYRKVSGKKLAFEK